MSSASRASPGRILLTLIAINTGVGPYIADFNKTHIYNPNWPPHAKFHDGQTMSMGALCGLLSLYLLYRPSPKYNVDTAFIVALLDAVYFVTQLTAWFYPGSAPLDPPNDPTAFPQAYAAVPIICLSGLGYLLEKNRLEGLKEGQKKEG
ncbi:MAG: hypothetical protein M1820_005984 [Bogoriella megaspora]|nr:MAG: hypothetical protein M1820_005984 [Bogoriella megaspora]